MEGTLMDEYRIEGIGLYGPLAADPSDVILDSLDAAGAIDAVASANLPVGFVSAMFTLDANGPEDASGRGTHMLSEAFSAAKLPAHLSRVCVDDARAVETLEDFERRVSAADIARMHGLTRERIRQLAKQKDFPAPVGRLGKSALYRLREVEAFFLRRKVSSGRSKEKHAGIPTFRH
jgi:hypothetical protein